MGMYMITTGEIQFVTDVLQDLVSLADPSEYLEGEVREAFKILGSLDKQLNEFSLKEIL